jgi:hypothetical protein
MHHNTLGLIALAGESTRSVLHGGELLLVPFPLAFEFLCNLLLENQSLQCIITLLLSARKTEGEAGSIILLLVDETTETSVLTLMTFDLDLEFRGLFRELLSKRLEFEELNHS